MSEAPKATRREWIGLAVIALPCLLYSMDLTVLYLAVPHLTADLTPTSAQLLWISDIYGFLIAGSLITMGTLGDRIGRRRLLLMGATAFGIASILAAFSSSAEMLIVTRAILGVAGATLAPSTLSLIRNMFLDDRQRTVAIGIWATSFSLGGAIGPVLGGVMLEHFWWGSVFLLSVPVMAALLIIGPRLLPEFRDPGAGRLDVTSAAMSLAAILAVIYGLKRIAQDGMSSTPMFVIGLGILIGITFVIRQRRLSDPLIDLRLFGNPAFSAALATNALSIFVAFGTFLFTSQYLQLVLGMSPMQAGLWMLPSSAGFVAGSMIAPQLVRRFRPPDVMTAGLLVLAMGLFILTQVEGARALALLVTGSVVLALGLSPVVTLGTDLIVGSAPAERAGAASSLSETGAELGGALGIAVLGSIGTAVYRRMMADAVPASVPHEFAEAARGTLGGAIATAQQLPGAIGAELANAARDAFSEGLETTAGVSALIALTIAIVAAVVLRRSGSAGDAAVRTEVEESDGSTLIAMAREDA
ncbi:MAG TPA: MFS transporter [Gemmatimonadaceae bacterium]|nr:MFS transporter [Gemmatimonadaceae bacterium]